MRRLRSLPAKGGPALSTPQPAARPCPRKLTFPWRSAQIRYRQLSRIRLLPWVADGEALACLDPATPRITCRRLGDGIRSRSSVLSSALDGEKSSEWRIVIKGWQFHR